MVMELPTAVKPASRPKDAHNASKESDDDNGAF